MSIKGSAESNILRGRISNPDVIHGKSAYEIDVMHGFDGTEEEWLKMVRGDFGERVEEAKAEFDNEVDTVIVPEAKAELESAKYTAVAEIADAETNSLKVLGNYTNGAIGDLKRAAAVADEKEVLLWENSDTNEAFVSQSIDIRASLTDDMESIRIEFLDQAGFVLPSVQVQRGQSGRISYVDGFTGSDSKTHASPRVRLFTFNANGSVSFEGADPTNIYCVPYRIYGVKNNEISVKGLAKRGEVGVVEEADEIITGFPVEIGNVSISAGYFEDEKSAWDYNVNWSNTTRVRLRKGVTLRLRKGDVIGLTDYSNARYFLGCRTLIPNIYLISDSWLNDEVPYGWQTADFEIKVDGDYIFNLSNLTEVTQTSPHELGDLVFVKRAKRKDEPQPIVKTEPFKMRSINHRGYNTVAPENTLAAFKLSKKNGFDMVETDVRWTSDGVPVLLHDPSINRTARNANGTSISGTVNISAITYAQALTYDFGVWKSSAYAGTKIPTFDEFIKLCRDIQLHPYIEIQNVITIEQAQALIDIVKKYNMLNNVTWISFDESIIFLITQIHQTARVGILCGENISHVNFLFRMARAKTPFNEVFFNADAQLLAGQEAVIERCKKLGIPCEVWTPNTEAEILALHPYISGVTTDKLVASDVIYNANID